MREPPNLLIVDDSTTIRKILIRVLGHTNLPLGHLLEAGDGVQAMKVLQDHEVSLILSDVNMPNMDGMQLLRALRASERWRTVPVILITTEVGQETVAEAIKLGAASYIRKPFSVEALEEKLTSLLTT